MLRLGMAMRPLGGLGSLLSAATPSMMPKVSFVMPAVMQLPPGVRTYKVSLRRRDGAGVWHAVLWCGARRHRSPACLPACRFVMQCADCVRRCCAWYTLGVQIRASIKKRFALTGTGKIQRKRPNKWVFCVSRT
jgi:hypothetical protein